MQPISPPVAWRLIAVDQGGCAAAGRRVSRCRRGAFDAAPGHDTSPSRRLCRELDSRTTQGVRCRAFAFEKSEQISNGGLKETGGWIATIGGADGMKRCWALRTSKPLLLSDCARLSSPFG